MSEENTAKDVEFYAATVNAWFNTRFEHDKSLLTLSAGGIALLITLLSTVGIASIEILILYGLALFSFVICLGTLLWIFRRNAKYLENLHTKGVENDSVLSYLDNVAISSFLLGVLFASVIGISTAVHSYQEKEKHMAENTKVLVEQLASGQSPVLKSIVEANIMAPRPVIERRSVEGAVAMKPAIPTAPAPVSQTASNSTSSNK